MVKLKELEAIGHDVATGGFPGKTPLSILYCTSYGTLRQYCTIEEVITSHDDITLPKQRSDQLS